MHYVKLKSPCHKTYKKRSLDTTTIESLGRIKAHEQRKNKIQCQFVKTQNHSGNTCGLKGEWRMDSQ